MSISSHTHTHTHTHTRTHTHIIVIIIMIMISMYHNFLCRLPYFLLVGGVFSVRGDHFLRLNGYSNMYWGWGGEDDDMGYRQV